MATATAAAETQDTTETGTSKTETRQRMNYKPDTAKGRLDVSYGPEVLELDAKADVMGNEAVKDQLAYMGLITYLQRESNRFADEEKLTAVEEAYQKLLDQGVEAFKRKSNAPTGPRKADKIAALAMIKGRTPEAVRDALKKLPQEKQDELLNNAKVLKKAEELRAADQEGLTL